MSDFGKLPFGLPSRRRLSRSRAGIAEKAVYRMKVVELDGFRKDSPSASCSTQADEDFTVDDANYRFFGSARAMSTGRNREQFAVDFNNSPSFPTPKMKSEDVKQQDYPSETTE